MPLNLGYIELACEDGDVRIRVHYDTAWLDADPSRDPAGAPLVNGPRGWCLDITNLTGRKATVTLINGQGTAQTIAVQKGDPVTTGPTSGRSRTAAQMAQLGFTTRGSVADIQLQC